MNTSLSHVSHTWLQLVTPTHASDRLRSRTHPLSHINPFTTAKLNPFSMYHSVEDDLVRATHLLIELSEQNEHNYRMSTNLYSLAGSLKVCACCLAA